jgi:NAD+ synthase (glutamine-hydrolysing)
MAKTLRVGLAQINTTVGDLEGNVRKALDYVDRARELGVDIVSFPELTVSGYPPEDLLLRPEFVSDNIAALEGMAEKCRGITVVIGFVDRDARSEAEEVSGAVGASDLSGVPIYNAAAVIHDGRLAHVYHKQRLPNYGVFDEARYFEPDRQCPVHVVAGVPVGVNICEDIWYPGDPTETQAKAGACVIVNINGSPYHAGKRKFREQMLAERAKAYGVYVCYTNQVGGQDELVFDGGSMVLAPSGELLARAAMFEEELLVVDLPVETRNEKWEMGKRVRRLELSDAPFSPNKRVLALRIAAELEPEAEVYAALVMGTRDYLHKTGFQKAVVALSGGIDSSLVAAIAVDALGAENVFGVAMPSRYSSEGSIKDAKELAENLGIEFRVIPIEPAHAAFEEMLTPAFEGTPPGVAEENIQARIRGNVVLSLSNKFGWIVLTTGNKSELATGYATLAGDLVGGFAVIKDVPKTLVYRLSRWRNTLGERPVIPQAVLTKPPSAELKPGQLDQDTLPPYDILDGILEQYVENDRSVREIVAMGFDYSTVARVAQMVDRNEYKRRQAPPGVKITPKAFGRDRRLPMASRYRAW